MNRYSCDFETVNKIEDCRVWLWGSVELYDHNNFKYGKDLNSFFDWVDSIPDKSVLYFHNLKFDGEFMLYFLFRNGFKWTDRRRIYDKEFKTLITDSGVWYAVEIGIGDKTFKIYDSLKIISLPVKKIGPAFGLNESKGSIDYNKEREIGYNATIDEVEYLRLDVCIVASALEKMLDDGHNSITQASNSMKFYKKMIGAKKFKKLFPVLEQDSYLRQSYVGGWCYVNPKYKNTINGRGIVVDNNSIYPYVMSSKKLPFGEPVYFKGAYIHDDVFDLYISTFRCDFELKPDHVPTIQLKKQIGFKPTEYVTSSNGENPVLCMTSVDIELFFKHYEVYNVEWFDGWKFKSSDKLFIEYVEFWTKVKVCAKETKNKGMYTIAKFFLNMLYGKFGLNPNIQSKIPTYDSKTDKIKYVLGPKETRPPIYVPVASFVTAYARQITITGAQDNFDRFMYADTDSEHLEGWELPKKLDIHPTRLGAWDVELYFKRSRYLHAKAYIEEKDHDSEGNELEGCAIACAGLPERARYDDEGNALIGFDDFVLGAKFDGKLEATRVSGGVVLQEKEFTIKY